MWNMQLCMAHLLEVSDFRYLQNSASADAKTSFSDQKWLYFQNRLLSFKDIEHLRAPNDAPCQAAYFTYQALNFLTNIAGLNGGNHLAKTGTEAASSGFSWNRYHRNSPKMEPLLTLGGRNIIRCSFAHKVRPYDDCKLTCVHCPLFIQDVKQNILVAPLTLIVRRWQLYHQCNCCP